MKKWTVTLIAAAVILGIAFASDAMSTKASKPIKNLEAVEQEMITLQEAKEIALQEADGVVKEIQLNKDNGKAYYEVEIHDGTFDYEIDIDAYTGEIIDFEKDADKKNVQKYSSLLSMDEAIVIAQKEAPNASLIEVEIGEDDGRIVFEIEMRDDEFKYEIDVDASTGEIVDIEKEQTKKSAKKTTEAAKSNEVEKIELAPVVTEDKQEKKAEPKAEVKTEKKEAPKADPKPEKIAEKKSNKKSTITMDEAIAIAKQHGSGVVTEVERDDGVYEIEMEDGNIEYEIEVNIYTGEVVSFEKDIDD